MASIVSAGTTSATALNMSADTSGVLQLASNNGTVALTITTGQNVGIGTTSPTVVSGYTTLEVNGNTSGSILDMAQGDVMKGRLVAVSAGFTIETSAGISISLAPAGVERAKFDTSGNFQFNSGYGSVATAYGCRAWARVTGGGGSGGLPATGIDAGGNASSLTRNSTGNYTLNFTTSMPDANYAFSGNQETGNVTFECLMVSYNQYTTGVNFITLNNGTQNDFRYGSVVIFR